MHNVLIEARGNGTVVAESGPQPGAQSEPSVYGNDAGSYVATLVLHGSQVSSV